MSRKFVKSVKLSVERAGYTLFVRILSINSGKVKGDSHGLERGLTRKGIYSVIILSLFSDNRFFNLWQE